MRSGLKTVLRRVWARRGTTPEVNAEYGYEWTYLYGFVRPATGETWWFILPSVNTALFNLALAEFAAAQGLGPERRIVLLLDGAGWHRGGGVVVPEGLHLVPLPAYSPQLQPAERLWPLANEAVANRAFDTIGEIEDALAARCRTLSEQPEPIRELTCFYWLPAEPVPSRSG